MIARFRNLLQRNLPAKVVAIIMATILWGYVMNDQNPTTEGSFTIPVQVINAPEGYKVTQNIYSAKIKVRGPRSLFVANNEGDIQAYVDLQNGENGKHEYNIQVKLPQGFELVELKPNTVEVTLDRVVQKKVRADITVTGSPAQGVTVAKVSQLEPKVLIEGPESAVNEVERVIGYVGLTAQNDQDFEMQVPLTAINADGKEVPGISVQPVTMSVSVQLARGLTKKVVMVNPVTADDIESGYELVAAKADPNKVEIAGDEKSLANINTINTERLSLAGITTNVDRQVKLALPDGVTVTNHDVTVHVVVKAKKKE